MRKLIAAMAVGVSLLTLASNVFAYEVKHGDTMSEIATAHNMSLGELGALNTQVGDLDLIFVGQHINTERKMAVEAKAVPKAAPVVATVSTKATAQEKDLLARLVRAEAQGEPYAGKVAVAAVVLNRVESDSFPDSINSVIYQKGQFSPVSNGAINSPADSESKRAVEEALTYNRAAGAGSLVFYNAKIATSRWLDSRPTTIVIGNHTFKK